MKDVRNDIMGTEENKLESKKVLNAIVQHEVIVYNTYAYPLCIINADASKSEWIYEHFSQIILSRNEEGYTSLDFLEDINTDEIMMRQIIPFNQIKDVQDIVGYLKQTINNNWQPILVVDFDYLHEKRIPPYPHFLIQIYLYGYDDEQQEFLGMGFNADYSFGEIRYSYEEVREAFLSMLKHNKHDIDWVDRYTLLCLKLKNPGEKYTCSRNTILQGLYDFCDSVNGKDKIRIEDRNDAKLSSAVFGMKAQEAIITSLRELLNDKFVIDFRAIHLLKEQKDLIYKKLKYLFAEGEPETLDKYKRVCTQIAQARLMYMMQVEIDSHSLYGQLKNKDIIKRIITLVEEATQLEKEILTTLLK